MTKKTNTNKKIDKKLFIFYILISWLTWCLGFVFLFKKAGLENEWSLWSDLWKCIKDDNFYNAIRWTQMGIAIFAIIIGLGTSLLVVKYFVYDKKHKSEKNISKKLFFIITAFSVLEVVIWILLFVLGSKISIINI